MLQPGDILAHYGRGWMSRVISLAQIPQWGFGWPPSHVSIVIDHHRYGQVIAHSTTLCPIPCVVQHKQVSGCQAQRPDELLKALDDRIDLYRLTEDWTLRYDERERLANTLIAMIERGTSYHTLGAIRSARPIGLFRFFPATVRNRIFCSAFIYAGLQKTNRNRVPLDNPHRFSPARLLRTCMSTGVYECVGDAREHLE